MPNLVLRKRWLPAWGTFIGCVLFTVACYWMVGGTDGTKGWLGVLFFGVFGIPMSLAMLFGKNDMVLFDDEGIKINFFRLRHWFWRWDQIQEAVYVPGGRLFSSMKTPPVISLKVQLDGVVKRKGIPVQFVHHDLADIYEEFRAHGIHLANGSVQSIFE